MALVKISLPFGLIVLLALAILSLALSHTPAPSSISVSFPGSSAAVIAEYEVTSIEVMFISPQVDGEYQDYDSGDGPEGPVPQPPTVEGPLKIYILQEATRKIIEIRNQAGTVVAKTTWTLSDLTGLLDDWTGPNPVWSSKVEVVQGNGGNGIGLWLWKFSERIFYQPGMTRLVVDMSMTQSGQTGWTTYHLPRVAQFIQQNVSNFTYLMSDPNLKMWIFQYP